MVGQDVEKLRVHERLAADDAEEDVAHFAGLMNQLVHGLALDGLLLGGHVHPATLAAQVAAIDDRDIQKRREDLAPFEALLVFLDRPNPFPAHVPGQLPEQALVGLEQQAFGHFQIHHFPFGD